MPRSRQPQTIEELLAPHRVWVTPCGCWLWLGADDGYSDADGLGAYGRILREDVRRMEPVHRYVYRKFKGPIPEGHDIDHMCARWAPDPRVIRKCVNPDHLQAVWPRLNQQLKLLRRLGYGTCDMELEQIAREQYVAPPRLPEPDPLLAPGEHIADIHKHL